MCKLDEMKKFQLNQLESALILSLTLSYLKIQY